MLSRKFEGKILKLEISEKPLNDSLKNTYAVYIDVYSGDVDAFDNNGVEHEVKVVL